jgi:hypothetical protein
MKGKELEEFVNNKFIVIGSGPSGIAACASLIKAGHTPVVFDTGIESTKRGYISTSEPVTLQEQHQIQKNKKWFGNSAPYLQWKNSNLIPSKELNACQSFGFGGFSRVWGGTFDYFENIKAWPNDIQPSVSDFNLVNELVSHAETSTHNNLSSGAVRGCDFSKRYLDKIKKNSTLKAESSKVAIETLNWNKCDLSGSCIQGCDKDAIWFAGNQIKNWMESKSIFYFPNYYLRRIKKISDTTVLEFENNEEIVQIQGFSRAFLACGPIGTGAILIRSDVIDRLEIKDTSTIFFGAFSWRKKRNTTPPHHTLSQWWVEMKESRNFRAQFYSPSIDNSLLLQERVKVLRYFPRIQREILLRLHPFIFYLNSKYSGTVIMEKSGKSILVKGRHQVLEKKYTYNFIKDLSKNLRKVGLYIPVRLLKISPPGSGFHIGSSIPHGEFTDHLGRLPDWNNIHIVDASVLPEIEVGSITPTIMVNSSRIVRKTVES